MNTKQAGKNEVAELGPKEESDTIPRKAGTNFDDCFVYLHGSEFLIKREVTERKLPTDDSRHNAGKLLKG